MRHLFWFMRQLSRISWTCGTGNEQSKFRQDIKWFGLRKCSNNNFFQILTKDSVTVFVNAIMYYKVRDPTSAVTNVDDYSGSARWALVFMVFMVVKVWFFMVVKVWYLWWLKLWYLWCMVVKVWIWWLKCCFLGGLWLFHDQNYIRIGRSIIKYTWLGL